LCPTQLLGPDLITLMQEGRIGLHNFFQFAERMLTAVESLHRCGLVHRDIKPGALTVCAVCSALRLYDR